MDTTVRSTGPEDSLADVLPVPASGPRFFMRRTLNIGATVAPIVKVQADHEASALGYKTLAAYITALVMGDDVRASGTVTQRAPKTKHGGYRAILNSKAVSAVVRLRVRILAGDASAVLRKDVAALRHEIETSFTVRPQGLVDAPLERGHGRHRNVDLGAHVLPAIKARALADARARGFTGKDNAAISAYLTALITQTIPVRSSAKLSEEKGKHAKPVSHTTAVHRELFDLAVLAQQIVLAHDAAKKRMAERDDCAWLVVDLAELRRELALAVLAQRTPYDLALDARDEHNWGGH